MEHGGLICTDLLRNLAPKVLKPELAADRSVVEIDPRIAASSLVMWKVYLLIRE